MRTTSDEIRAYIVNSQPNDQAEIFGGWFQVRINAQKLIEKLAFPASYDYDYIAADYDLHFETHEEISVEQINYLMWCYESLRYNA